MPVQKMDTTLISCLPALPTGYTLTNARLLQALKVLHLRASQQLIIGNTYKKILKKMLTA